MTNITQKEQKDKWLLLNRESFMQDLLSAQPKDYQERNWFYRLASIILSYPLQVISILAGSYLLFDIFKYVWQLDLYMWQGLGVFAFCIFVFVSIEMLRRWLVNTTGDYYVRSFKIKNANLKKGEWLKSNILTLLFISVLLISTGTMGIYQYIKNNSPEIATLDMEVATSSIEDKIKTEKTSISRIDKDIQSLIQAKKQELADKKSYAVWNGKEYLLPEVKTRHTNYDKQINAMNQQRHKHQDLISQYEQKLSQKEEKTENQNAEITAFNKSNKELYAGVGASVWLGFEILLVFVLAYNWIFKYKAKKEKLLEILESQASKNKSKANVQNLNKNTNETLFKNGNYTTHYNHQTTNGIGFQVGRVRAKTQEKAPVPQNEPEVIIKEVIVEKPVEVVKKTKSTQKKAQGFHIVCANCGKETFKKRPAKYCSTTCRTQAWKARNEAKSN